MSGFNKFMQGVSTVGSAVGSLLNPLGGFASALGGLGSLFGFGKSDSNYKHNLALMREQNAFNSAEARKAFLRSEESRIAQNQWQQKMFDTYSTPAAQAAMLRRAGFNPALALEGSASSVGASSGSSVQSPAASASGTPFVPMSQPGNWVDMASSMSMLATARQAGANADLVSKTADKIIASWDLKNEAQVLANSLNKEVLAKLPEKMQAEISNLVAQATDLNASAEQRRASIRKLRAEGLLTEIQARYEEERIINTIGEIKANIRLTNAKTDTEGTKQNLNIAQTNTEGVRQDMMRSIIDVNNLEGKRIAQELNINKPLETYNVFYNKFLSGEVRVDKDGHVLVGSNGEIVPFTALHSLANQWQSEFQLAKDMPELNRTTIEQQIERLKKANDWYEVQQILAIINTAIEGYTAYKTGVSVSLPQPRLVGTRTTRWDGAGNPLGSTNTSHTYQ